MLSAVQHLCRAYGITPAHNKGQNFLVDEKVYDEIMKAAALKPSDIVLEVGPGLGFLTAKLAKACKQVVAVELDEKLADLLRVGLDSQGVTNVEIVNSDILKFSESLERGERPDLRDYKIVANLPYNISSNFLRRFLSGRIQPREMVLLLQKEVVQRLAAVPPDMSLLALSVQYYGQPEMLEIVPPKAFWPAPKVESALVRIRVKPESSLPLPRAEEEYFFRLLKFAFSSKRKMLKNNLAGGLQLSAEGLEDLLEYLGFNPKIRAQELDLEKWLLLFAKVRQFMV
jgi:16S rRNA (adenine1518-N6/adenine1519-N6)-dimethyltransferase